MSLNWTNDENIKWVIAKVCKALKFWFVRFVRLKWGKTATKCPNGEFECQKISHGQDKYRGT